MSSPQHAAFLDGVTGYLGRWTLFWLLEELPDERVAVLIRPSRRGALAQQDAESRLDSVLQSIGMASERHRVTVIPGDLDTPGLGNIEAMHALRADTWIHIAGDVRFKKLGDPSALVSNRDYTINFITTARHARYVPHTVCHTSTFYVFEQGGSPDHTYTVPEDFHHAEAMRHHNAYGYSKLQAEVYLQDQVRSRALPFTLLIFRPDIVMHHVPAREVAAHNPGLVTDDFKVIYELLAALVGASRLQTAGGPAMANPIKYLPVNPSTILYVSDIDTIARAMMQLAVLHGDGQLRPDLGYRIFHLVNRWQPITCGALHDLCAAIAPEMADRVSHVSPEEFDRAILPGLSWLERTYYGALVEPFAGYLNRARTDACTSNVDEVLGRDWHNLHPESGVNVHGWLLAGVRQAAEKQFGRR